jgi:hypothetical protein
MLSRQPVKTVTSKMLTRTWKLRDETMMHYSRSAAAAHPLRSAVPNDEVQRNPDSGRVFRQEQEGAGPRVERQDGAKHGPIPESKEKASKTRYSIRAC